MTVAYDGTAFHGFARNRGVATVAGTLSEALERVLGHRVELICAGRTDKGVHAQGQVVSLDVRRNGLDIARLAESLNKLCGPDIAVRELEVAPADFDARFSATSRTYRYTILNSPVPDPFLARHAWHLSRPLDLAALRIAADALIGEHDFSSFCRRPKGQPEVSLVRRVLDARWREVGEGLLRFEITGTSFCHQMVRSVVGTMVEMGDGRSRPGRMLAILAARDRHAAGQLAPPHGLCLWSVAYTFVNPDTHHGVRSGSQR